MKDLPHYMKKLNRQVVRSNLRENAAEESEASPPTWQRSEQEQKKLAKIKMRQEHQNRTPMHDSEEERNQKMKHRTPIFDRNNAKPRVAKPTRKKTPRI